MICSPCADAADGVPGAEHCDDTGGVSWSCACGHRPPVRPADTEKETDTVGPLGRHVWNDTATPPKEQP